MSWVTLTEKSIVTNWLKSKEYTEKDICLSQFVLYEYIFCLNKANILCKFNNLLLVSNENISKFFERWICFFLPSYLFGYRGCILFYLREIFIFMQIFAYVLFVWIKKKNTFANTSTWSSNKCFLINVKSLLLSSKLLVLIKYVNIFHVLL